MLHKVWEIAVLVIVVSLAAKLLLATITPLIPTIMTLAIVISIAGTLFHKKRKW